VSLLWSAFWIYIWLVRMEYLLLRPRSMILAALLLQTLSGSSWHALAATQMPPTGMADSSSKEPPFDTNYRSISDIVWSCIVTIFACTWLSVHPNVCGTDTTWTQRIKHRISLMLWGIAAPEFLVIFAYRQWKGSRNITRAVQILVRESKLGDLASPRARNEH
jgi:hypothetical protein